jgi:hypothetical protein
MATQEAPGKSIGAAEPDGVTAQVQQQVQEKAQDVKAQAAANMRKQLDGRSSEIGEQVNALGGALRRAAVELEGEGKTSPAKAARGAADRVERVGGYLRNGDADAFLNDVERFARSRPWAAGGLAAVLGFSASRFLKASSGRRYDAWEPARPGGAVARLDRPTLETGPVQEGRRQ